MKVYNEAKNKLLENKTVTIIEKGNPYEIWEFTQTNRGIKWRHTYSGEKGKIDDLLDFFQHITDLAIYKGDEQ